MVLPALFLIVIINQQNPTIMKVLFETRNNSKNGWKQITVVEKDGITHPFCICAEQTSVGTKYSYSVYEYFGYSSVLIPIEELVNAYNTCESCPSDPDFYFDHP